MFRLLVFVGVTLFCAVVAARADLSHKVQKGETLFALSRKYGVSLKQLQNENPGLNPQSLKVGQILKIPQLGSADAPKVGSVSSTAIPNPLAPVATGSKSSSGVDAPAGAYRVQPGDSLSKIARSFKITVTQLKVWNDLPSDKVVLGRILRVTPPDANPVRKNAPVSAKSAPPSPIKPPVQMKQVDASRPSAMSAPAAPARAVPEYFFVSKVKREIDGAFVKKARWRYIVVHHSGTRNGNLKIFDYYHRHKGMVNGVAYHFVIGNGVDSGDGEIEVTNRWKKQIKGGHLASEELNQIALGICLVGDFEKTRPTRKQIAALVELIDYISQKTGPRPRFVVHREINPKPTDCPGRYFPAAAMHRLFDGKS